MEAKTARYLAVKNEWNGNLVVSVIGAKEPQLVNAGVCYCVVGERGRNGQRSFFFIRVRIEVYLIAIELEEGRSEGRVGEIGLDWGRFLSSGCVVVSCLLAYKLIVRFLHSVIEREISEQPRRAITGR